MIYLKASSNSLVFKILLKAGRKEIGHSYTRSPFHRDGATTEKAQFLVDAFLDSLGVAACRSIACVDQVAWTDVLRERWPDRSKVPNTVIKGFVEKNQNLEPEWHRQLLQVS